MSQMPSAHTISRYQRLARSFANWSADVDDLTEAHRKHKARINAVAERIERVGTFLEGSS